MASFLFANMAACAGPGRADLRAGVHLFVLYRRVALRGADACVLWISIGSRWFRSSAALSGMASACVAAVAVPRRRASRRIL
jgi:hypothetical protein